MTSQQSDQLLRAGNRGMLSKSMPPKFFVLTQDEEKTAVRMHLKKKRSKKTVGSSLRSSSSTQRTFLDIDLDSSFESHEDDELEQLFKRKHSLTLDERIALKNRRETSSRSIARNKTRVQSNRVVKKKQYVSKEQDELSSDDECAVPDCQFVDSIPLSYSAKEASSVLRAYDKKLTRARSHVSKDGSTDDTTGQNKDQLQSYEKQMQVQIKEMSDARENNQGTNVGAKRPGIVHVPHSPSSSKEGKGSTATTDSPLDSFEDRFKKKLSQSRRRSVSAPRPGIIHVPHSPSSSKKGKGSTATTDHAVGAFEDRLKKKLSQSRRRSVSAPRPGIAHVLHSPSSPKESQTNKGSTDAFEGRLKKKPSQSSSRSNSRWQCDRCTYLNRPSSKCKICFEPRGDKQMSRQEKTKAFCEDRDKTTDATSRPRLAKGSKSERLMSKSKRQNGRNARNNTKVSQSMNAATHATSWSDLAPVIDQTISMSLLDTK